MPVNSDAVLKDLREQFGPVSVLYAEQVGQLLGKSTDAVYALHKRNGLPFPVLAPVGARPCVNILDVAEWLSSPVKSEAEDRTTPSAAPPVPAPKRKQEALGGFLRNLAVQRNFLADVYAEIERQIIEIDARESDTTNADLGRGGGPV